MFSVRDTRMFTSLEGIHNLLKENNRMLRQLLSRSSQTPEESVTNLPQGVKFPVSTVDEMEDLDVLLNNQQTTLTVVSFLLS